MLVQSAPAIVRAPKGPSSPDFARLAAVDKATLRGVLLNARDVAGESDI